MAATDDITDDPHEANNRFMEWRVRDPLPKVHLALLNRAQIFNYVLKTGMVCPFPKKLDEAAELKVASYGVGFLGEVHEWGGEGKPNKVTTIKTGTHYVLRRNSIAFVRIETELRLPTYIAARFNLQIKHVHRGLLLGTGPLIDPGFSGRLFIPLHNLTANDYAFTGGDGFIWFEFTKLQPLDGGDISPVSKTAAGYWKSANMDFAPRSSIPEAMHDATVAAKKANRTAEITGWAVGVALVTILLALASVVYGGYSLVSATREDISTVRKEASDDKIALSQRILEAQKVAADRLKLLEARMGQLEAQPPKDKPKSR